MDAARDHELLHSHSLADQHNRLAGKLAACPIASPQSSVDDATLSLALLDELNQMLQGKGNIMNSAHTGTWVNEPLQARKL